jgi:glyoxylase-like metal-dependent hydrolase (beta-lactamase superfamily II)
MESRHFTIEEVSSGVYACIATERGGAMSNAGIIDMGEFALIFDTFNTPQAGEDLKTATVELLGKPIKYVINSHWHGDHMRGNQNFMDTVIISSNDTRDMMIKTQDSWLNRMKPLLPNLTQDIEKVAMDILALAEQDEVKKNQLITHQCFLEELKQSICTLNVTLPTITYNKKMSIYGALHTAQVISMGQAHTLCDSILYIPEKSIIFAADIVSSYNHPLFSDGNHLEWLQVLNLLEDMGKNTIIPGHGTIVDTSYLNYLKQYIQDLIVISQHGIEHNGGVDFDVSQVAIPEAYKDWGAPDVFYRNLEFLKQFYLIHNHNEVVRLD